MAKKTSGSGKTGTQPRGNNMGMQGSGKASINPKGMNAKGPASNIASGKGPGKQSSK